MPTAKAKSRTKRRATDRPTGPAAIRNEHARPRASMRPSLPEPPQVVERPDLWDQVTMMHDRGEQYSWDNIAVWRLFYLCRYGSAVDCEVDCRSIIAATRARAVQTLRDLLTGYGISQVLLIHVLAPPSGAEVEEIRDLNARKPWLGEERGTTEP